MLDITEAFRSVFFLILNILTSVVSFAPDTAHFVRLPAFDDYLHTTNTLTGIIPAVSKIECASKCMKNLECGSFFYIVGTPKKCQLHSVLFLTPSGATAHPGASYYQLTQDRCPYKDGYVLYRPVPLCYRFVSDQIPWVNSKTRCESSQAHLLYVKSPEQSTHIRNFLQASSVTRNVHVSIGGMETNRVWSWLDNTPVTWTNWASGEPNSPSEKCLSLAWFYTFLWNDIGCSNVNRAYICQLDI